MSKKKQDTIRRLREDEHLDLARELEDWRSAAANNSGWDSWFASRYPEFADRYGVAQGHRHGIQKKSSRKQLRKIAGKEKSADKDVTEYAGRPIARTSSSDVFKAVAGLESRPSKRQFDVYCFADYRGDKRDTSGGIALALGIGGVPSIFHVYDIVSRNSLATFWRDLIALLGSVDGRLIFGQDHQYGVPKGLLDELGLRGPWRAAMSALFEGERFGAEARMGNAGGFAKELNRVLVNEGKLEYFYSCTKSELYGIPKNPPRSDDPHRLRITERSRSRLPFPFARVGDNGSVGGQSIVGIPNILSLLRSKEGQSVFAWPFDGIDLPDSVTSVLVEVYPSALRLREIPQSDLNDAVACVDWCMREDANGRLSKHLSANAIPNSDVISAIVRLEGWYMGIE